MYTIGGATTLAFSDVDWYRTAGAKALGDARRKDCDKDDDATLIGGSCLPCFDAAERHREDSRRREVAMVST